MCIHASCSKSVSTENSAALFHSVSYVVHAFFGESLSLSLALSLTLALCATYVCLCIYILIYIYVFVYMGIYLLSVAVH